MRAEGAATRGPRSSLVVKRTKLRQSGRMSLNVLRIMFWFAHVSMRGRLPSMTGMIRLGRRDPRRPRQTASPSAREGRGRLRSAARPNEPEEPAEFNGLAIHESKQTQFPTASGRERMSTRLHAGAGGSIEPLVNRGLVTATLVLASMIYSIDWTIAAVALPHMQGTFSSTQDQISWVLTSYIVASAVMLPATGWLAGRLGRKNLFLLAVGGFTVFSLFCGMAGSLPAEVLLRIGQAACGAFLIPLSQAIMLDAYPREEHGWAMAFWGMGVVLGPVIGPDAGRLPDRGAELALGVLHQHPGRRPGPARRLPDLLAHKTRPALERAAAGLASASSRSPPGVGAMQMMLDRGERLDWFDSPEIMIEAIVMVAGLYFFVAHSLTARARRWSTCA